MCAKEKRPEITVFAGPNGSGKSTIKRNSPHGQVNYINADEISMALHCDNLTAAQKAEEMRNGYVDTHTDFSFETVLSTPRNLELLKKAKSEGFFIRGIFVLTTSGDLNVARVKSRVIAGGHDVPVEKIVSRYEKALANVAEFVSICDVCHIYDNTFSEPTRIFRKKKNEYLCWSNQAWSAQRVSNLVKLPVVNEKGRRYVPSCDATTQNR
jgi:Uncharacterized protein conserved in bacteria